MPVAALLIILVFFPGLRTYFYVKENYPYINTTAIDYPYADVATPDNFKEITCFGLTLSVPPELKKKFPEETEGTRSGIYVDSDTDCSTMLAFMENTNDGSFSLVGQTADIENSMTGAELDKAMKKLGLETPKTYYDFYNLVLTYTLDDFPVTKHGASGMFITIAEWKELLCPTYIEYYPFERETGIGFIYMYGYPNENSDTYKMVVDLYDKETKNICHSALIYSEDFTIVQQIVNSAKLADE